MSLQCWELWETSLWSLVSSSSLVVTIDKCWIRAKIMRFWLFIHVQSKIAKSMYFSELIWIKLCIFDHNLSNSTLPSRKISQWIKIFLPFFKQNEIYFPNLSCNKKFKLISKYSFYLFCTCQIYLILAILSHLLQHIAYKNTSLAKRAT